MLLTGLAQNRRGAVGCGEHVLIRLGTNPKNTSLRRAIVTPKGERITRNVAIQLTRIPYPAGTSGLGDDRARVELVATLRDRFAARARYVDSSIHTEGHVKRGRCERFIGQISIDPDETACPADGNNSAAQYEDNIADGVDFVCGVGDSLSSSPGLSPQATLDGLNARLDAYVGGEPCDGTYSDGAALLVAGADALIAAGFDPLPPQALNDDA